MAIFTTLNNIREHAPCASGWSKLLKSLDKTHADDVPLALEQILDSNGLDDALWALQAVKGHDKELRLFACQCARLVLPIFEKKYPEDDRPRKAIEAAEAFGASPMRIICTVLLPEASAGLLRGLTITLVSLIGYSAMAGIVGGGGVGDLAIRFGYYRYETQVMIVTVVALIILVQVVQVLGDWLAKRADKRDRH